MCHSPKIQAVADEEVPRLLRPLPTKVCPQLSITNLSQERPRPGVAGGARASRLPSSCLSALSRVPSALSVGGSNGRFKPWRIDRCARWRRSLRAARWMILQQRQSIEHFIDAKRRTERSVAVEHAPTAIGIQHNINRAFLVAHDSRHPR